MLEVAQGLLINDRNNPGLIPLHVDDSFRVILFERMKTLILTNEPFILPASDEVIPLNWFRYFHCMFCYLFDEIPVFSKGAIH